MTSSPALPSSFARNSRSLARSSTVRIVSIPLLLGYGRYHVARSQVGEPWPRSWTPSVRSNLDYKMRLFRFHSPKERRPAARDQESLNKYRKKWISKDACFTALQTLGSKRRCANEYPSSTPGTPYATA